MIRCTCGAELFSIESICSACLPPKPPRALFVEDLRIKLANREEELLDWKETVELVNTENVELRAERDRLKAEYDAYRETSCEIISCLKSALLDIKHFGAGFAQDRARKALGDAS